MSKESCQKVKDGLRSALGILENLGDSLDITAIVNHVTDAYMRLDLHMRRQDLQSRVLAETSHAIPSAPGYPPATGNPPARLDPTPIPQTNGNGGPSQLRTAVPIRDALVSKRRDPDAQSAIDMLP